MGAALAPARREPANKRLDTSIGGPPTAGPLSPGDPALGTPGGQLAGGPSGKTGPPSAPRRRQFQVSQEVSQTLAREAGGNLMGGERDDARDLRHCVSQRCWLNPFWLKQPSLLKPPVGAPASRLRNRAPAGALGNPKCVRNRRWDGKAQGIRGPACAALHMCWLGASWSPSPTVTSRGRRPAEELSKEAVLDSGGDCQADNNGGQRASHASPAT